MFSKELQELDRNTVQYMIDVMQEEIDASKQERAEHVRQLGEQMRQLEEQGLRLAEKDNRLRQQELEQQLYEKLARAGRQDELLGAVSDAAFRQELLEKEL